MSPYVIAVVLVLVVLFLVMSLGTILIDASGGDAPDLGSDVDDGTTPVRLT
jgi:hypothetical protein